MTLDDFEASLAQSTPPGGLTPPMQALWWLAKGGCRLGPEWERAHAIAQSQEGIAEYDWVHALVHRIEGDEWNAGYWYRRAGKAKNTGSVDAECRAIYSELNA